MHLLEQLLAFLKQTRSQRGAELEASAAGQQAPAAALFDALTAAARQLQDTHAAVWQQHPAISSARNRRTLLNRRVKHQQPPSQPKHVDVCGWQTTIKQVGSVLVPEELAVELVALKDLATAGDWRLQTSAALNTLRQGSYLRDLSLTGVWFGLNRSLKMRLDLESDLQGSSRATTEAALELPTIGRPVLTGMVGGDVRGGGEAQGWALQFNLGNDTQCTWRWFQAEGFGSQAVYQVACDQGDWRTGTSWHWHRSPGCTQLWDKWELRLSVLRAVKTPPRKASGQLQQRQQQQEHQEPQAGTEGPQRYGQEASTHGQQLLQQAADAAQLAAAVPSTVAAAAGSFAAADGAAACEPGTAGPATAGSGKWGKKTKAAKRASEHSAGAAGWRDAWEVTVSVRGKDHRIITDRCLYRIGFHLL